MTIKTVLLAALVGLGGSFAADRAEAQVRPASDLQYGENDGQAEGLSSRTLTRIVRSHGLTPVSRPTRRSGVYHLHAADDYGRVRLVRIDAYTGEVIGIDTAGRSAPRGEPPRRYSRTMVPEHPDFASPAYGLRPPRGVPVRPAPRRAPPEPYYEDEEDFFDPPRAQRGPPPSSPRVVTGRPSGEPLPPLPDERAAAPAPRREQGPRVAAMPPATAPLPRPRPAAAAPVPEPESAVQEPEAPAEAPSEAAAPPAAAPAEEADTRVPTRRLPRVVLPGGPLPKAERTAETRPGQRVHDNRGAPPAQEAQPPAAAGEDPQAVDPTLPPVQPPH